jgi:hypothetical protein
MPGASSSLLPNKYFDNLYVNRLKAIDLKTDNLNDDSDKNKISYLFSIISDSVQITNNSDHLLLKLLKSKSNIIKFSDRPFRIIDSNFSLDEFASLFYLNSYNSFKEDLPNVVLSTGKKQQAFELFYETHNSYEDDTIDSDLTFKLVPLENERIIYDTGNLENISLFIDNFSNHKLSSRKLANNQIAYYNTDKRFTMETVVDGESFSLTSNDNLTPPNSLNINYYDTNKNYKGYIPVKYNDSIPPDQIAKYHEYLQDFKENSYNLFLPNRIYYFKAVDLSIFQITNPL